MYIYIYIYHTLFNTPLHNNNCVILSSGRPLIVALIEDPGVEERGLRDEDESQVGKPLSPALSPESIYRLMTPLKVWAIILLGSVANLIGLFRNYSQTRIRPLQSPDTDYNPKSSTPNLKS